MLGVKLMSRINNVGVIVRAGRLEHPVILLLFHAAPRAAVIFHSYGFGAGHPWGYFGALLVGGLLSAYVMYGFDTAGTLAEETNNPRKHAPPAIIRAIAAAAFDRRPRDPARDRWRTSTSSTRTSASSACRT